MKIAIILMCISICGYSQSTFTITNYKTKLLDTYSIDKVIHNNIQDSYKITNIYDLSSQQVDITKINKTYNLSIYESTPTYKKQEYYNPYLKVKSGFEKKPKKKQDEFDY